MAGRITERLVYAVLVLGVIILVALGFLPQPQQTVLFPKEFAAAAKHCRVRTLTVDGGPAEDAIAPTDCRVREMLGGNDNTLAHPYQVTLRRPATLNLSLASGQFDAYLIVYDPQRNTVVCRDDDSGGGRNARCMIGDLPAGNYLALAKALGGGAGAYQLQATSGGAAQTSSSVLNTAPPAVVSGCRVSELPLGPELPGVLSDASCRARQALNRGDDTSPADVYRISVLQAGLLQVDVRSTAFDSYVHLLDAQGTEIASDDDGGGGRNARVLRPAGPGSYLIVVRSLGHGTGPYAVQTALR